MIDLLYALHEAEQQFWQENALDRERQRRYQQVGYTPAFLMAYYAYCRALMDVRIARSAEEKGEEDAQPL